MMNSVCVYVYLRINERDTVLKVCHLECAKIGGECIDVCVSLPPAGVFAASPSPVSEAAVGASVGLSSAIPSAGPSASPAPGPTLSAHAAPAHRAR